MLSPIKQILPITLIQRQRLLPVSGRIAVRKGQNVAATDVVAEAKTTPEHILLNISLGLGLPADQADGYIQRQAGEKIDQDDVIAGPVGIGHRVVRSPKKGTVVLSGGGQVLIEVESRPLQLRSGFSGIIRELVPDRGVIVETTGALIQGTWGNGHMNYGLLHVLARSPDEELRAGRLDVSLRGAVVLGGYCAEAEILHLADELPLRGLILSSMDSALVPQAKRTACPIILLEGFGNLPMNSAAFKLLSTSQRREVSVLAEQWDPISGTRPEIIIPLPTETGAPLAVDSAEFRNGIQVRVTHSKYQGRLGTIERLLESPTAFPSGIKAQAAQVNLGEDDLVILPLVNLEILGNILE